jgi:universal stress protein A
MNEHPKKILLATDFSPSSAQALAWASSLAHDLGATLLMLHVEPGQATARFGSVYAGIPDPGIAELARDLAAIKPTRPEVRCEHHIRAGDPATEIIAEAEEQQVEAIVVGSHGHGLARQLLLGSVAEAVLRKAGCPVMICKTPRPADK